MVMKQNERLRALLMKEKDRLIYEYGKMSRGDIENNLEKCIKDADYEGAKKQMERMRDIYYASVNPDSSELSIEEKIDILINMCETQTVNSFNKNKIRSNRAKKAKDVKEVTLDDVNEEEVDEITESGVTQLIQCPMSGEEDIGVLLITEENILDGVPKNVINQIINCPFALLDYPRIVEKVKNAVGGIVGLKTLKETKMTESPITAKKIKRGIILAPSGNETVDTINEASAAFLFTGGKILGAPLYYIIALYEILKDMEEYCDQISSLKELIRGMLVTSHSFASMSGMVAYIATPLRTDIALWFIAHSFMIEMPPANDPFILHLNVMKTIIDVLKDILGYPVSQQAEQHYTRLTIIQTLHMMKHFNSDVANSFMRALYQKAIFIDKSKVGADVQKKEHYVPFVFIDGHADGEQIEKVLSCLNPIFRSVTTEELITLDTYAHEKLRVEGTVLPIDLKPFRPTIVDNWKGTNICGDTKFNKEKMVTRFVEKYGRDRKSVV